MAIKSRKVAVAGDPLLRESFGRAYPAGGLPWPKGLLDLAKRKGGLQVRAVRPSDRPDQDRDPDNKPDQGGE